MYVSVSKGSIVQVIIYARTSYAQQYEPILSANLETWNQTVNTTTAVG